MKKESLILDTSLFVNPVAARCFGPSPTAAMTKFLESAATVDNAEFFMPPSVYSELMHFAEEAKIPKKLLLVVRKQPPRKHEIKVPGIFIYDLVENMRNRVDRGLRLAERHVREALQLVPPPKNPPSEKDRIRPDVEAIGRLRESYRRIMREGMLDSKMDADLLLLAYELKGILVSADEGVLAWADNLGIQTMPHDQLLVFMNERRASSQVK